ncbi:MAG: hypothetical protein FJ298_05695 [Planctomycetes bacterium]|nr:hypothetical protein [Planctomycetota bacterium]
MFAEALLASLGCMGEIVFEPALGRAPEGCFVARAGGVVACARAGGLGLALLSEPRVGAAIALDFGASAPEGEDERCRGVARSRGGALLASDRVHARVRWREVAAGIDVLLRAGGGGFEYDLELRDGACVREFEARVRGHEALWLGPEGELVIETAAGPLVQPAPTAWVARDGRALECRFELRGSDRFGFVLAPTDGPACIDPMLRFSTYLTGDYEQEVRCIAQGPYGVSFAAGTTLSIDFPTTLGAFDPYYSGGSEGFVACLSSDGSTLLWSTLLGGSADDSIASVRVTRGGSVVVGGTTFSADFPTTAGSLQPVFGGAQDAFVARLEGSGTALEWSTYLGGALAERFGELELLSNDDVVLCGGTRGGLPTNSLAYDASYNGGPFFGDAFVARLRADGAARVWCTYLGGAGDELAERVAVDANDGIALSGSAYSALFPTSVGAFDRSFSLPSEAWVARLDPQGSQLLFATYLGGSGEESVLDLALEPSGSVLCVGEARSADFPLEQPLDASFDGESEGFFARFAPQGDALLRASFLGGLDSDRVSALAHDALGRIVLGGDSLSEDLPTTLGAWSPTPNVSVLGMQREVFLARLPATLDALDYCTYFGSRQADRLHALALDASGEPIFGGVTHGPGLPVSPTAFQPSWNVLAISQGYVARLALELTPIAFGAASINSLGARAQVRWQGYASGSESGFQVGIDNALPLVWSQAMSSLQPLTQPYLGGRLYLAPPLKRYPRLKTDFLGYALRDIPIEPWLAGQTLYFQVWYEDPGSAHGAALSAALRVFVYP